MSLAAECRLLAAGVGNYDGAAIGQRTARVYVVGSGSSALFAFSFLFLVLLFGTREAHMNWQAFLSFSIHPLHVFGCTDRGKFFSAVWPRGWIWTVRGSLGPRPDLDLRHARQHKHPLRPTTLAVRSVEQ